MPSSTCPASRKVSTAKSLCHAAGRPEHADRSRYPEQEQDGLNPLGKGELKTKVTIFASRASAAAVAAVEKAGGKVELLPAKENKLLKGKLPKKEQRRQAAAAKTGKK